MGLAHYRGGRVGGDLKIPIFCFIKRNNEPMFSKFFRIILEIFGPSIDKLEHVGSKQD